MTLVSFPTQTSPAPHPQLLQLHRHLIPQRHKPGRHPQPDPQFLHRRTQPRSARHNLQRYKQISRPQLALLLLLRLLPPLETQVYPLRRMRQQMVQLVPGRVPPLHLIVPPIKLDRQLRSPLQPRPREPPVSMVWQAARTCCRLAGRVKNATLILY